MSRTLATWPPIHKVLAELEPLSDGEAQQELRECLSVAVDKLYRAACLVKLLEQRGHDLSALRELWDAVFTLDRMHRIFEQTLLPALVTKFPSARILKHIENLPIEDQKRLVADEKIPVVVTVQGFEPKKVEKKTVDAMSPLELRQVFPEEGEARIATVEEQAVTVHNRPKLKPPGTNGNGSRHFDEVKEVVRKGDTLKMVFADDEERLFRLPYALKLGKQILKAAR